MKPLTAEEIIFINDEGSKNLKGVTVANINTSSGEETRIAIWNMIPTDGGYLTPKGSGISLKVAEFNTLTEKIGEIKTKIQELSVNTLDDLIASFNRDDAVNILKRKLNQIQNEYGNDINASGSSKKKKRVLDHEQT